jgi:hypothetical protein
MIEPGPADRRIAWKSSKRLTLVRFQGGAVSFHFTGFVRGSQRTTEAYQRFATSSRVGPRFPFSTS